MYRFHPTLRAVRATALIFAAMSALAPSLSDAAEVAAATATTATTNAATSAPTRALPPDVFAIVNGVALQQQQLNEVTQIVSVNTNQPMTLSLREAVKRELIVREVVRQAAERAHYSARPEVQRAIEGARIDTETHLYVQNNARPPEVTDAQVRARYQALIAGLGAEQYKPRVLTVDDEATARKVLAALRSGRDFRQAASQFSTLPGSSRDGELPWVSFPTPVTEGNTQGMPLALARTLASLPAGGVAPQPVHVGDVWMIVKLDDKRPTQIPAYDEVKANLRQQLETDARQDASIALTDSLVKAADIQQ